MARASVLTLAVASKREEGSGMNGTNLSGVWEGFRRLFFGEEEGRFPDEVLS